MDRKELQEILNQNKLWVDSKGKEGRQAPLAGAALFGVDFTGADLEGANLAGANLIGANLAGANLRDTYLRGADLCGAKGILQWQSPQGCRRVCYSVKHRNCVMHRLECFWGTTEEAVEAIRKKYGENSLYEKFLLLQAEALEKE